MSSKFLSQVPRGLFVVDLKLCGEKLEVDCKLQVRYRFIESLSSLQLTKIVCAIANGWEDGEGAPSEGQGRGTNESGHRELPGSRERCTTIGSSLLELGGEPPPPDPNT